MTLTKMEKAILQCLYDGQRNGLDQDPDIVVLEELLPAYDLDPTDEEMKAYLSLLDKELLFSFEKEPEPGYPNRHIMMVERSKLEQFPDIIAGKKLQKILLCDMKDFSCQNK